MCFKFHKIKHFNNAHTRKTLRNLNCRFEWMLTTQPIVNPCWSLFEDKWVLTFYDRMRLKIRYNIRHSSLVSEWVLGTWQAWSPRRRPQWPCRRSAWWGSPSHSCPASQSSLAAATSRPIPRGWSLGRHFLVNTFLALKIQLKQFKFYVKCGSSAYESVLSRN